MAVHINATDWFADQPPSHSDRYRGLNNWRFQGKSLIDPVRKVPLLTMA